MAFASLSTHCKFTITCAWPELSQSCCKCCSSVEELGLLILISHSLMQNEVCFFSSLLSLFSLYLELFEVGKTGQDQWRPSLQFPAH